MNNRWFEYTQSAYKITGGTDFNAFTEDIFLPLSTVRYHLNFFSKRRLVCFPLAQKFHGGTVVLEERRSIRNVRSVVECTSPDVVVGGADNGCWECRECLPPQATRLGTWGVSRATISSSSSLPPFLKIACWSNFSLELSKIYWNTAETGRSIVFKLVTLIPNWLIKPVVWKLELIEKGLNWKLRALILHLRPE